ncbi:hypothetical protein [Rhizobium sophoriradicis]|uniref:hypothetical protein n=1 Tax=Rhizobium sophoriradicis TaxID=1535245 RepID=UPI00117A75E0|nr:hypothetical protein [Rhizobium sophoriradicis]
MSTLADNAGIFVAFSLSAMSCPPHATAAETQLGDYEIRLCHVDLQDRSFNPNFPGGWSLIDRNDNIPVLCLYGSLATVSLATLYPKLAKQRSIDIVVKTTGGPVDVWLPLGEALVGKLRQLVVDEACFSSCANYLVPLATRVIAGRNTLIVWHGGPITDSTDVLKGTDVPTAIHYDDLARRTQKLYELARVDGAILAVSTAIPSTSKFKAIFGEAAKSFSGYAFSPTRLTQCFRFKNLKYMWHAGDDEAVAQLGMERSSSLALLENPSAERDGSIECLNR